MVLDTASSTVSIFSSSFQQKREESICQLLDDGSISGEIVPTMDFSLYDISTKWQFQKNTVDLQQGVQHQHPIFSTDTLLYIVEIVFAINRDCCTGNYIYTTNWHYKLHFYQHNEATFWTNASAKLKNVHTDLHNVHWEQLFTTSNRPQKCNVHHRKLCFH